MNMIDPSTLLLNIPFPVENDDFENIQLENEELENIAVTQEKKLDGNKITSAENPKSETPKTKEPKIEKPKPTLDQLIAQKEDELARLKEKHSKEENGIKFVLGGWLLNKFRSDDQEFIKKILPTLETDIIRPSDKNRIDNLVKDTKKLLAE